MSTMHATEFTKRHKGLECLARAHFVQESLPIIEMSNLSIYMAYLRRGLKVQVYGVLGVYWSCCGFLVWV